ncbi:15-hydroxyprostaglandin dehydrogenase [Trichonephila clavipes]|nr:15-hydroxyprostaglandin dehydrogenase [Trichonephila clavipes]
MTLGDSLPQINLGVQGGTQRGSHKGSGSNPDALQGTNRGSGPAMEESENDVGNLEQLLLYADKHYLVGKLPLGDHLGKVQHGVEEYHQSYVDDILRLHINSMSTLTLAR